MRWIAVRAWGSLLFLLGIIVEEKMLLDFDGTWGIAPAGATKGHENKRSLRSPFGNLRRRHFLVECLDEEELNHIAAIVKSMKK